MDAWEVFFREKSRRRFRTGARVKIAKGAVIALIAAEIAVITVMLMQ